MVKDTGERVIPEKMKVTNNMLIEHLARYHFAGLLANGRVLDMACGSGYGTHILAKNSKHHVDEVIGIDKEQAALDYAEYKYFHPQSTFKKANVVDPALPGQLGKFDCIVSFETLEHIQDEKQFLANINQMLKANGMLILSTPFGKGRGQPCQNPFHVHQLTIDEFKDLFNDYASTTYYLQKSALIIPAELAQGTHFPIGIAVCRK